MKKIIIITPLFLIINLAIAQVIPMELTTDTSGFPDLRNRIKDQCFFIKMDSFNIDAYRKKAHYEYQLGDYENCLKDLNKVMMLKPNSPDIYCNRGMCYVFMKKTKEAIRDLDEAIKLEPDVAVNYLNRAYAKSDAKDYKGSILDLNKAIAIKPDYAKAFFNRGASEEKLNQLKEALQDYNKAIELNPFYLEAFFGRGALKYKLKDFKGAISDYDKVLKMAPDIESNDFYTYRGQAFEKLGDTLNSKLNYLKAATFKKTLFRVNTANH
ncbi:MAG TPA: tetratricopeptide repeat protein [Bacteroidia bacterium]|nr:tetratricopeptide repeat protein [Bacteroidia bacterium]